MPYYSNIYKIYNEEYIAGLIATKRSEMLDINKVERLLDEPDFDKSTKVLAELSTFPNHLKSYTSIAGLVEKELTATAKWLQKNCNDDTWLQIALVSGDTHNKKELLKSELDKSKPAITDISFYSKDKVAEEEIIEIARKDYKKNKSLLRVDQIIESKSWETALSKAKNNGDIILFFRAFIDFRNLSLAQRHPE